MATATYTEALPGLRSEGKVQYRSLSNFVDLLQSKASSKKNAFSFMANAKSGDISDTLSYKQLDYEAQRIAAWLIERGAPGERVLLLFPDGLDFIKSFSGCLYAGAVAVPAPMPDRFSAQGDRTAGILRDADVSVVLTDNVSRALVRSWLVSNGFEAIPCESIDDLISTDIDWRPPKLSGESLAFLQYTSGSTSDPKGVMISHDNLMANLLSIQRCIGSTADLRAVGWLPAIHDMGLIGQLLSVIYAGGELLFMPPGEFLRRPHRWLQLIDQFNASATAAPNFAYDLCLRRISKEQAESLNLSHWDIALNGAEPIQAETINEFVNRFSAAGFRPSVFAPCYGLAEATLLVSGSPMGQSPVMLDINTEALSFGELVRTSGDGGGHHTLVSSGRAEGSEVLIVDPASRYTKPEGVVGEIWVRGPSVAQGYWRCADATAETFGQETSNGDSGYLRTGDLGTVVSGELYVTGRLKDVVVVNGRNLYPQDMERAIQNTGKKLFSGASAVFTLDDSSEEVVVVQEVKPAILRSASTPQDAMTEVKRTLMHEFSLKAPSVVLVRPGAVRKTTSGKIRRSFMRELFLNGALEALHKEITPTALTKCNSNSHNISSMATYSSS